MKRGKINGFASSGILLVLLMVLISDGVAAEPNSIGGLLKEKGLEWLTGKWETTTEKGEKAQASFSLEMDGYIICVEAKVAENEFRGIMFYEPSKRTIVLTGVDNRGSSLTGSCEVEGGKLVMNLEKATADGRITKFTRYLSRVDADTMKSETYVLVDGKRQEEPTGILEFKRKK